MSGEHEAVHEQTSSGSHCAASSRVSCFARPKTKPDTGPDQHWLRGSQKVIASWMLSLSLSLSLSLVHSRLIPQLFAMSCCVARSPVTKYLTRAFLTFAGDSVVFDACEKE